MSDDKQKIAVVDDGRTTLAKFAAVIMGSHLHEYQKQTLEQVNLWHASPASDNWQETISIPVNKSVAKEADWIGETSKAIEGRNVEYIVMDSIPVDDERMRNGFAKVSAEIMDATREELARAFGYEVKIADTVWLDSKYTYEHLMTDAERVIEERERRIHVAEGAYSVDRIWIDGKEVRPPRGMMQVTGDERYAHIALKRSASLDDREFWGSNRRMLAPVITMISRDTYPNITLGG